MTHPIPEWLRTGRTQPNDATLSRTKADRELDNLERLRKAQGYTEAVDRLRRGLAKCPSPALLELLEPYLRDVLLGYEMYSEEAKLCGK